MRANIVVKTNSNKNNSQILCGHCSPFSNLSAPGQATCTTDPATNKATHLDLFTGISVYLRLASSL